MRNVIKILLHKAGWFAGYRNALYKKHQMKIFKKDFEQFLELSKRSKQRFVLDAQNMMPCLEDKTSTTPFDAHYIYHPAWAMRVLQKTKPKEHIDISSILYFSTMASAFFPVKFYDYRPVHLNLKGLQAHHADLTALPFEDNSIASISCMHTVEHIGLGRYGDPLDYDGDLKAINEIKRVAAIGGDILFVVPITGNPVIRFNGHRIYSYSQVVSYFSGCNLEMFSLIPDNAETEGIIDNATELQANQQIYGCGCFWFKKVKTA